MELNGIGKHERRFFNRWKLIIDSIELRARTVAGDFAENAKLSRMHLKRIVEK